MDEEITTSYKTNLGLTPVRLGTEGTKLPLLAREDRPSFDLKEYGRLRVRSHGETPDITSRTSERGDKTDMAARLDSRLAAL